MREGPTLETSPNGQLIEERATEWSDARSEWAVLSVRPNLSLSFAIKAIRKFL